MVDQYREAQVCLNGHTITRDLENEGGSKFCPKCGEKTVTNCVDCDAILRGSRLGGAHFGNLPPDSYCYSCGEPYPWTKNILEATRELANEFDELDDNDRTLLVESIPDLIVDTPNTEISKVRFGKVYNKLGEKAKQALYKLLVDVLSNIGKDVLQGR